MVALVLPLLIAIAREVELWRWHSVSKSMTKTTKIDLTRADALTLTLLPGIGRVLAGRIITYREHYPLRQVTDLLKVKGIGPKLMARLQALAVVGPQDQKSDLQAKKRGEVSP